MAYFFSKLKEQATSFQSIAKTMMVYENSDQRNDEDDDEEVLDDPINDTLQRRNKGSGSKKASRNNSIGKDGQATSATIAGLPPGGLTKDNFDDFF
jgi:hypothetical protein